MATAYCMKCKKKQEMKNPSYITTKRGSPACKGQCKKCDTNMYAILPKDKSKGGAGYKSKSKKSKSKSKKTKSKSKSKKTKSKSKKSKY